MTFRDSIVWILRALWMQKTRSTLSVVGFAIGIAAMVLLSSLGEGLRRYVLEEFSQFGSHILAVTPGKTETHGISGILSTTRPLTLEDAGAVSRLSGVELTVPVVAGTAQLKAHGSSRYTNVYGVGPQADKAWKLALASGTFLPQEEFTRARAFAVLGSDLLGELFPGENPVGEFIHVGSNRFRIIGVLEAKGDFLGTDLDDAIYVPAVKALQMFNRTSLMELDVFYSPGTSTQVISERVKTELIRRHGFEDFTIVTQDQMLETMDNILRILKYAGGGLGAISLLVGGVGITTILTITVTERVNEVGLLRALGGTRSQIRKLFLGEAVVLGFIGGFCGVMSVVLFLAFVKLVVPALPIGVEVGIIAAALLISMAIGLIAGLKPAMDATKLSPIDALRAE